MRSLFAIPRALLRPDRVFADQEIYKIPKSLILLAIFLLVIVGQRLSVGYQENPRAKELLVLEANARMSTFMMGAPPEAQTRAREQMISGILGQQSSINTAVGIVFSSLLFLLMLVEMWLVCMVVSQFFGGQEERHGRDRPSLTLFLVAFFPLVLRKLISGIVFSFKDPEAAANALTFADFQSLSAVRFDFYSLIPTHVVPTLISSLAQIVTDPFILWTFTIVTFGGREVFHVSLKSAVGQSLILIFLLGLQATLLKSIGITMEI